MTRWFDLLQPLVVTVNSTQPTEDDTLAEMAAMSEALFDMARILQATIAEDGPCPASETHGVGRCWACGWHEHECPSCRHVWSHDARIAVGSPMVYDDEHHCPKCKTAQFWVRSSDRMVSTPVGLAWEEP